MPPEGLCLSAGCCALSMLKDLPVNLRHCFVKNQYGHCLNVTWCLRLGYGVAWMYVFADVFSAFVGF